MTNEQLNSGPQSAIRELSVAELDAVSGGRLVNDNPLPPPWGSPSPTNPG